jgi:hypothetical protein
LSTIEADTHYKILKILRAHLAENKESKSKMRRKNIAPPQQEQRFPNWVSQNSTDIQNVCVHLL